MKIDIHTHVLPGIDDGTKDWDMSLRMFAKSAECGVQKVIATPHYLPWRKGVPTEEIRRLCREAQEKLRAEYGITMDIYPGNEIYYSLGVVERIKKGEVLTLADSRYVLTEFKTASSYQELCRAVRELRDGGYVPIIAHVERYQCLEHSDRMSELKQMGALMQMNVDSLQGGLFHAKSRRARQCLANGGIDFLASDMHDLGTRSPMSDEKLRWVQKKLEPQYQKELLSGNAERILSGVRA